MRIKPDYNLKNIYEINLAELKNCGIKLLMFDLDSTIMVSKTGTYLEETKKWLDDVQKEFQVVVISNNNSVEYLDKVRSISNFRVIGSASKPDTKVMEEYLKEVGISPNEAVMIGDRPLTDILCGKRLGCMTILVGSINAENENLPTRFVRWLERCTIKK
jgi:hypothetical protein